MQDHEQDPFQGEEGEEGYDIIAPTLVSKLAVSRGPSCGSKLTRSGVRYLVAGHAEAVRGRPAHC
jgi:hypothetical protein